VAYVPESTVRAFIRARFGSMLFSEIFSGRLGELGRVVLYFIIFETFSEYAWISLSHAPIIKKVYTLCIHFFSLCDDFDRFRVRVVDRTIERLLFKFTEFRRELALYLDLRRLIEQIRILIKIPVLRYSILAFLDRTFTPPSYSHR